jgi:DNA-binding LacI/PurR family transcriptional regulator
MARTRLKDIAQRAGVSESTVSRVLNHREGIAEDTQRLVREAARALSHHAVGDEDDLVGVLVPDLENPIFSQWADRLEADLFQRDAATIIATRPRGTKGEQHAFHRFLRLGVRGVVVVSGFHAQQHGPVAHYRELLGEGINLALINGVREDLAGTFISTDDVAAIELAVGHLQDLGHSQIGLALGDEHTWPVRQKVRAFERLIDVSTAARTIAYTDFSYAGGYEAARELLRQGMSAIICGSDVMATGAIAGVRSLGKDVPRDVSVVGFDDVSWARLTSPALTTLRQDVPQMSRAAVQAVLASPVDSRRPERTELLVPPQLVARESTGASASSRRTGSPVSADTMRE